MKKAKSFKKITQVIAVLLIATLSFLAVFFLMQHVQELLVSDAEVNLTEVVTQNTDVISSKLTLEVNNLQLAADQIAERMKNENITDDDGMKSVFLQYAKEKNDDRLFIAGKDGIALFPDGDTVDVSGRNYYKLAISGSQNISDKIVSRKTGDEIFVISVPVESDAKIIGALQKVYTPDEMYNICAVSLFSDQGYMSIINSDGYILISSRQDGYSKEADNYYRMLYAQGNREASARLEEDIKANRSGFMETTIDGEKTFSGYMPIKQVHDWYLISSIATSAVSANANTVVQMFYFILLIVAGAFTAFLIYFWSYKNKQQATLSNIAFVDPVTKGNTYNKFVVDVPEALRAFPEQQFYVMVFDIDNFKYVNNFYGFDKGDRVLKKIDQTVREKLLPSETAARISGDHFIALLRNADEKRLFALLDSIQENKGIDIDVYVSAGLYMITDREESVNIMMDKARMAQESIKGVPHKRLGIYTDRFDEEMIRNEQLKRSLEQALQNDEVIPFYQPKVDVNTRALVGAEALARWRTKDGQMMPPSEFIPMCEKTGLITDLDMTIYEKVLKFLRRNLDEGVSCVPVSANFSRLHLADPEFVDKLIAKAGEHSVPAGLIEIELTESVFFDNYGLIAELIERLHKHGFLISIDDFGSGYSSLNMLKDIPVDIIKIDRGFLKESADSEKQRIIFEAIAQMAERLHIAVVVEGVENEEGVRLMKEYGCSVAQGFYFARPMDEDDFENIFREGKL